jgi:mycothiol synthase
MTTLIMRPYLGKTDLKAIADLVNVCDPAGQVDKDLSVTDLQIQLNNPALNKARDLRLWEDTTGTLVGFGQIALPKPKEAVDGYLYFYVHPKAAQTHLESDIIHWGERRMLEVRKQYGLPALLRSSSRDDVVERISLLEDHQFTVDRYFLTMNRTLDEAISTPNLPEGFIIRPLAGETEVEAWVNCFNQSFIDHWNHHDLTPESVKYWLNDPYYRADLNLVAVAPNGRIAAFCNGSLNVQNPANSHQLEGWINWLGTGRDFRKMGLGRAMLLSGMQALKDAGAGIVKLAVDADSPTGATRLYESVGFKPVQTWRSYVKPVAKRDS